MGDVISTDANRDRADTEKNEDGALNQTETGMAEATCARNRGVGHVLNAFEKNRFITADDVKVFLRDLELPRIPDEKLKKMMKKAGAVEKGFNKPHQFFAFVIENLKDRYDEEDISEAFQQFDLSDSGFLEMNAMRTILENFGDEMLDEEVDQIICMSDLDGNGNLNYEEVIIHLKKMAASLDDTLQTQVAMIRSKADILRVSQNVRENIGLRVKLRHLITNQLKTTTSDTNKSSLGSDISSDTSEGPKPPVVGRRRAASLF